MRRGAGYGAINPLARRPQSAVAKPFGEVHQPPFVVKGPEKSRIVRWSEYKSHLGEHRKKFAVNEGRRKLIRRAFNVLDADGSGEVTIEDMRLKYNAKMHPDVIRGIKSEDEILRMMMEKFEEGSDSMDGVISLQEFEQYYAKVGEELDDDYFAVMIMSAWRLDAADTTQRDAARERAKNVEPSDTDKRIMRGVAKMMAPPSVERGEQALVYLHEMLKSKNGSIKFVKLGGLDIATSLSYLEDDPIRRSTAGLVLSVAEDAAALALMTKDQKKSLVDQVLRPLEAGTDPVARQKAARAKELISRS